VATKHLARESASRCTVIGAGVQARTQIEAVHLVRPLQSLRVVDVVPRAAAKLAEELGAKLGVEASATQDVRGAIGESDIVVTASSSHDPVLDGEWLRPGTHINNVGSHSPDARELDTTTVKRAKFVADLAEANLAEAGDLLIPIAEGAVSAEHIHASLGEIVIGERPGRESDDEITVFKSCGLAVQDVATARVVYEAARERGIGTEVEL
jgi:ornithine cyclodeaminase/alanine dehydrogenase-like protein (mu-crystallin family)